MTYLLDTPVVSEYLKKRHSVKVIEWLDARDEYSLCISCLTIAELQKGYYKLQSRAVSSQENRRAAKISAWITKLEQRFADRTVQVDRQVLEKWATICGSSEAEGMKLPVIDSLLAASALTYEMTVVTPNVSDFRKCSRELEIYNPYSQ